MVYIDEHYLQMDLQASLAVISEQRRQQALSMRHDQGRRQSVGAYLLLKQALRDEAGIEDNPQFSYGPHGQPFLADYPEWHFSMSHCREAVGCVLSRQPVGLDIESVGRMRPNVLGYAMNDDEQAEIMGASDPQVAFTRLWTMKESLLKLQGCGLHDGMRDILKQCRDDYRFTTIEVLEHHYVYTFCEQL